MVLETTTKKVWSAFLIDETKMVEIRTKFCISRVIWIILYYKDIFTHKDKHSHVNAAVKTCLNISNISFFRIYLDIWYWTGDSFKFRFSGLLIKNVNVEFFHNTIASFVLKATVLTKMILRKPQTKFSWNRKPKNTLKKFTYVVSCHLIINSVASIYFWHFTN